MPTHIPVRNQALRELGTTGGGDVIWNDTQRHTHRKGRSGAPLGSYGNLAVMSTNNLRTNVKPKPEASPIF